MYGETISDEALLIIADDCRRQMRSGTYEADYMTKNRTDCYWGERGFLGDYMNTIRALDFLIEKGEALKKEKLTDINGKPTAVTEYNLRRV